MTLDSLAWELVRTPSPSGDEGPALLVAEKALRDGGFRTERQPLPEPGRFNLFAWQGRPRVVLTTHLDTVPGDVPARVESGILHGRGACDAKGMAASLIHAAIALRDGGHDDVAVLLVVGEETTSDGALAANEAVRAGLLGGLPEAALFGEPTGMRWISAHPGVLMVTLSTIGQAAHSSAGAGGASAIHALLDVLARIRAESWPDGPLGATTLNVGRIRGGSAPNVVAAEASADVMFRTGADPGAILARLREIARDARVDVSCSAKPIRFDVPEGEEAIPVTFATDAPNLPSLGRPHLFGPGEIRHAHAADEQVGLADLHAARDVAVNWAIAQLRRAS